MRHDASPIPGEPPPTVREPKPPRVTIKSLAAFCAEYEPMAYTIAPIVRSASLYSFTGRTGHGKTGFLVAAALAVAADRGGMVGRDVDPGVVVYVALENPDDTRMRFMVAADRHQIDVARIGEQMLIVDRRETPEELRDALAALGRPIRLIVIDTFSAAYDGKDVNDAVQAGEFTRRLRPLTRLRGLPSVLVACHPVKNAPKDQLPPYGSGAILNEVDGNLTLWKEGEIATLHWQGKLRGLEFDPAPFRIDLWECDDVLDRKGQRVPLALEGAAGATARLKAVTVIEGRESGMNVHVGVKVENHAEQRPGYVIAVDPRWLDALPTPVAGSGVRNVELPAINEVLDRRKS